MPCRRPGKGMKTLPVPLWNPPANSPVTVSGGWIYNRAAHKSVYVPGKGKNKPLFDTGALYDAFDYEVIRNKRSPWLWSRAD